MNIIVNGENKSCNETQLDKYLSVIELKQPFAIAINTVFIPKTSYGSTYLKEGDQIDIVSPIVGG